MVSWVNIESSESRAIRTMLGSFLTGVTVVATRGAEGQLRAFTANSFTSVSLDPALVLVCLGKSSSSCNIFAEATSFSINILNGTQRDLSSGFGSREPATKYKALSSLVDAEVPYVGGSLATMICDRYQVLDAGDHILLMGKITRFSFEEGQPLGFFRGSYVALGPAVAEIEQLEAPLMVGGILDIDGKVLLTRKRRSGDWQLPASFLPHGAKHSEVLSVLFGKLGVHANANLLYSLFQESGESPTTMMFSMDGSALPAGHEAPDGSDVAFFGPEDKPWDIIQGDMKRGMLRRYFEERAAGRFGIYYDTADGGRVAALDGKPRSWTDWRPRTTQAPLESFDAQSGIEH